MADRHPLAVYLGLALALLLLTAADAPQALRATSADIFLIRQGEVVHDDLYVVAGGVVVDGVIEGDLIVLAGVRLEITGHIKGDVTGFAATSKVEGTVDGSVRLVGVEVDVAADVGGDVVGLGRDVDLGGSIAGDALVWARSLAAGAEIGRDLVGRTFGTTTIDGSIGRDVEMTVAGMQVLEGARISEDLGYRSAAEASVHPGATIGGTTVHRLPLAPDLTARAFRLMIGFVVFTLFLAFGILRIRFCSHLIEVSLDFLARHPLKALLRGLISLALPVLGTVGLVVALIWGSPSWAVSAALGSLFAVPLLWYGLVSSVMGGAPVHALIAVGRFASRGRLGPYGSFVLATVLLALSFLVPYVWFVALLLVLALGLGSAATTAVVVSSANHSGQHG